jgi:putative DNA primase/helicase
MIEIVLRNIDANGQLAANVDCFSDRQLIHSDRLTLDSDARRRAYASRAAEKFCGQDSAEADRATVALDVERALENRLADRIKEIDAEADEPPDEDSETPRFWTQQGNAEELIALHRGTIRFNASSGCWMIWRKGRWIDDGHGEVENFAKRQARSLWAHLAESTGEVSRDTAIKHIRQSETAAGVSGTIKLARSEIGISVEAKELDADGWALNCLNGTVDLRNGNLRPHRAEDLNTKQSPVAFDPAAACPLWDSVLNRIMAGNEALIGYLRRLAGMFLTADVTTQELYIPHGAGANGKSVVFDTLTRIMGDYAGTAPESLLTIRSMGAEHPTEIADLCGKRLVVASETEEGARLRIQLVKRLTGDMVIKGRYMRQDFFQFPRTHKLVLVTNNRPVVRETTHAIWRRVRLIPFTVTIPEAERDLKLLEKLRAEDPGILDWAIRGCVEWQANGLQAPDEVMLATKTYQQEQDPIADFITDRCTLGEDRRDAGGEVCRVTRNDLYMVYQSCCSQSGERHPLTRSELLEHVRRLPGIEDSQWRPIGSDVPVRGFVGIRLTVSLGLGV